MFSQPYLISEINVMVNDEENSKMSEQARRVKVVDMVLLYYCIYAKLHKYVNSYVGVIWHQEQHIKQRVNSNTGH